MRQLGVCGQVVILNGAPRSGKSSIAAEIQETFDGTWMNLGVDVARLMAPPSAQPGIGLRPGEVGHTVASIVPVLYAALYESIAAHSKLGLNVVVDVGHYEIATAVDSARRLAGLPVLFVGVRCSIEVIMERRRAAQPGTYAVSSRDEPVPDPILLWQHEVHAHWAYDLEVDTSTRTAAECAVAIRKHLDSGPTPDAFGRLAQQR